jgi:dihydropyrimidinase
MNVDYSAYEGMEITGKVDTVLSRGQVIVADNQFHGKPGNGKFLSRDLCQYLN